MTDSLLILVPVIFLGGVVSAFAGGGLGIIITLLMGVFFPIQESLAISALLGFVTQLSKVFHFRYSIRWDIVWWYGLPGLPAAFLAGFLLFLLPSRAIEVSLGLLCLWMSATEFLPFLSKVKIRAKPTRSMLVFGGVLNGIISGIIGNGSGIRGPLLLAFGLRKEIFIGTSAMVALFINSGRSVSYAQHIHWTMDLLILFVVLIPLLFVSIGLGKNMLQHADERLFELFQAGIMGVAAIRFLFF